jgi:hypothetical protein
MSLIAVHPHMHLLGREMKVWARMKDESVRPLIHIDDWDFNWQGFYFVSKPVALPLEDVARDDGRLGQLGRQPAQAEPTAAGGAVARTHGRRDGPHGHPVHVRRRAVALRLALTVPPTALAGPGRRHFDGIVHAAEGARPADLRTLRLSPRRARPRDMQRDDREADPDERELPH